MSSDPYFLRPAVNLDSSANTRDTIPFREARQAALGLGPVPKFLKVKSAQDLQPRINSQPLFRRANPEGGFISVCNLV